MTSHSVHENAFVRDDVDRRLFLDIVDATVEQYEWDCLALCILDTHYHLLVTTRQANIALGMQFLNGRFAQLFNLRHGRRGHLFRERYWGGLVAVDGHLVMSLRYVALNPVAAGLARHPCDYPWSSYPGVVGVSPCWSFVAKDKVLELFGPSPHGARRLRALVEGDDPASPALV
ncbi:MAG: transposase [Actinobacteria bacterium]|nr:transposase [Actinomycetota bacterium]